MGKMICDYLCKNSMRCKRRATKKVTIWVLCWQHFKIVFLRSEPIDIELKKELKKEFSQFDWWDLLQQVVHKDDPVFKIP